MHKLAHISTDNNNYFRMYFPQTYKYWVEDQFLTNSLSISILSNLCQVGTKCSRICKDQPSSGLLLILVMGQKFLGVLYLLDQTLQLLHQFINTP